MVIVEESEEYQTAIVDTPGNKKRGISNMLYTQESFEKASLHNCSPAFTHFPLGNTVAFPKLMHSPLLTCRWNCQLGSGVEDRFIVVVMGIEGEASSSKGNGSLVGDHINTDILLCLVEIIGTPTKTADL